MTNFSVFSGNLGKDAEIRTTENGSKVASFSVATKAGWGKNEITTWYNCSYWGKGGEAVAPYLKKGQMVVISGETWNEEYNGKTYAKMSCVDVTLAGSRQDPQQSPRAAQPAPSQPDFDDDIPFS